MGNTNKVLGQPLSRVDGKLKVTGAATYAADYVIPNLAFGMLASSAIARGRIKSIDTSAAEKSPGVIAVITHLNAPKPPGYREGKESSDPRTDGRELRVFYNDVILYNGQPVALTIADTFERARYAASLVKVQYIKELHQTDIEANLGHAVVPKEEPNYSRGSETAFDNAAYKLEQEYRTQLQVHNPMEPHAAIAVWEGNDKITVYNKTQSPPIAQADIAKAWKLQKENVHIISHFVGGAFGSASRIWPHEMAAIIGAKKIGRPLKVVLSRDQLFNMVGYRPVSVQKIKLGADKDGKLTAIHHEAYGNTSTYEEFTANMTSLSQVLYNCDNVSTKYRLVPLDVSTPCWTRAPGEAPGSFALESALDELAYSLKIDPLELRKRNYATQNPDTKQPWSTKFLNECYEQGAAQFGWNKRSAEPRSMRKGDWLIGMGMSSGIYGAWRAPSSARAVLNSDGTLLIQSATADVGVGTATIMSQIAADATGIPIEKIKFELGDSRFPPAVGQFGSLTTTSVGSAVNDVCVAVRKKVIEYLKKSQPSLQETPWADFVFEEGKIKTKDGKMNISYTDVLQQQNLPHIDITVESKGDEASSKYSSYSYNATFVEVGVHALTNQLKVNRVVSTIDSGKIMNMKTARNQVYGSVTWGIGMALMEESVIDHRYGRWMVKDLADYHVPVHADIPKIEVNFIDKSDDILTPIGAKGLGEIGIVGVPAAIANAVYHATGKRIRELPITPDKLT